MRIKVKQQTIENLAILKKEDKIVNTQYLKVTTFLLYFLEQEKKSRLLTPAFQ